MSKPRVLENLEQLDYQSVIHTQNIASLQDAVSEIQEQIAIAVIQISTSSVSIGQEIYLYEGDVLTPFIVVEKDYVKSGNVIVMRKYPLPPDILGTSLASYINSPLDTYLDGTYSRILGAQYSPIMLAASNMNGTSNSDDRKIFIPSYAELTGNSVTVAGRTVKEGSQFTYFSSGNSVICTHNGIGVNYFLRTPYSLSSFYIVTLSGGYSFSSYTDAQYIRPFVSLSSSSSVYKKIFNDVSNTFATAVVTN